MNEEEEEEDDADPDPIVVGMEDEDMVGVPAVDDNTDRVKAAMLTWEYAPACAL